ncbi:hypothetical protein Patl1_15846 [Pistacia atlantica]|uniref:Uncharacterized protein n=1 Tax=Pistacia atlantica TaxID=434234 RepID=A0ACC1B904_9ROSI|nr:hypothetical protein Patl1_15846 [Pistacia atlantica]
MGFLKNHSNLLVGLDKVTLCHLIYSLLELKLLVGSSKMLKTEELSKGFQWGVLK